MIIPMRCVTCNKVLSHKWRWYNDQLSAAGISENDDAFDPDSASAIKRRELFDTLGLLRYCCRRHFMGQVDLVDKL
jgi:DNA-directed RNA polymerase I, II, and III subunit RPABC5